MLAGATKGDHVLRVDVKDKKWERVVTCTVTVRVVYLNDSVVTSSASLRLAGVFSLTYNNSSFQYVFGQTLHRYSTSAVDCLGRFIFEIPVMCQVGR